MIGWIMSFFSTGLGTELRKAFEVRENAEVGKEQIAADVKIAGIKERIEQRNKTLGSTIGVMTQTAFAMPFIVYLWKLIIWDKVLKLGATDDLSVELWEVFMIILGGYFVIGAVKIWRK